MARANGSDSRTDILRTAARLFQERGYDATSMQDIAGALSLSKAALYHHFVGKEQILIQIMTLGMDIFEERVLAQVKHLTDPDERLRACISLHVQLVLSPSDREITVVLHENRTLPAEAGAKINARKKAYVSFLTSLIASVQAKHGVQPAVEPQVAAFALLGMINWMYQWYRPQGTASSDAIARQYAALFYGGILSQARSDK